MGDHETTGTKQQSNPTSQVGTHGNAAAGDRMNQGAGKTQGQGQGQGQAKSGSGQGQTKTGMGQGTTTGAEWSDQQPGYAGGTKDDDMTQGDRTSRPQPSGTTPLEHEGRPKA